MLGPQEGDVQLGALDSELIFKAENSHVVILRHFRRRDEWYHNV